MNWAQRLKRGWERACGTWQRAPEEAREEARPRGEREARNRAQSRAGWSPHWQAHEVEPGKFVPVWVTPPTQEEHDANIVNGLLVVGLLVWGALGLGWGRGLAIATFLLFAHAVHLFAKLVGGFERQRNAWERNASPIPPEVLALVNQGGLAPNTRQS